MSARAPSKEGHPSTPSSPSSRPSWPSWPCPPPGPWLLWPFRGRPGGSGGLTRQQGVAEGGALRKRGLLGPGRGHGCAAPKHQSTARPSLQSTGHTSWGPSLDAYPEHRSTAAGPGPARTMAPHLLMQGASCGLFPAKPAPLRAARATSRRWQGCSRRRATMHAAQQLAELPVPAIEHDEEAAFCGRDGARRGLRNRVPDQPGACDAAELPGGGPVEAGGGRRPAAHPATAAARAQLAAPSPQRRAHHVAARARGRSRRRRQWQALPHPHLWLPGAELKEGTLALQGMQLQCGPARLAPRPPSGKVQQQAGTSPGPSFFQRPQPTIPSLFLWEGGFLCEGTNALIVPREPA